MPTINTDNRNKYALITGATSGIGYELAKLFAKDGYSLVLVARNMMGDKASAENMRKLMEPSKKPGGRKGATHGASKEERSSIGKSHGDYEEHKGHVHK